MNKNSNYKNIRLVFPDIASLWAFSRNLSSQNLEINTFSRTLICNCTDEEIDQAIVQYGARKVDELQATGNHYNNNDTGKYCN